MSTTETNPNELPFPDVRWPPFQERRPKSFSVDGDELLADKENALKNYADVYGAQLFQARDDIVIQLTKLGEDSEFRSKLGTVKAAKFEQFSSLPEEHRSVAVQLAEDAMNQMIFRVAQILGSGVRDYPGGYSIEFDIHATVYKIMGAGESGVKLKKVGKQRMTGDPWVILGSSFGRWLNKFGVKRDTNG